MNRKRVFAAVFLMAVMALSVVASGCIGGNKTTTTTISPTGGASSSTSSPSSASTQTTSSVVSQSKAIKYIEAHLSSARVIETPKYVVVVGPKGSGAKVSNLPNKPVIVVSYKINEEKTPSIQELMKNQQGFGQINPAFLRDPDMDALIQLARKITDPNLREALYNALLHTRQQRSPRDNPR